jgi:hypothetical protein
VVTAAGIADEERGEIAVHFKHVMITYILSGRTGGCDEADVFRAASVIDDTLGPVSTGNGEMSGMLGNGAAERYGMSQLLCPPLGMKTDTLLLPGKK